MSLNATDLQKFTGTERWFQHGLVPSVTYTEGVQYVAEQGGAYWLIDKIATAQLGDPMRRVQFQVWKLRLDQNGSGAELTCEAGNDRVVHRERIDFTDFPLAQIDLWFTDNVILLPSEY